MTYAQRIRLGEILTSGEKEYKIFRQIFECLCDGYEPSYTQEELQYVMEVIEGIRYWIERERAKSWRRSHPPMKWLPVSISSPIEPGIWAPW